MVFTPARGDAPARFGPDVPMIPDIGTALLDASVYTDPERYQRERSAVLAPSWQVICRWHSWVYDLQGAVVGVPDREDFDPAVLDGLAAPAVECAEWGGWVWAVLAGPGAAPPLLDAHIQLFRAVPLAVDRTRFETWELQYPGDDQDYRDSVSEHWGRLQQVVAEDVEIWAEVAATRDSSAYRRNILNNRECKLTAFHHTIQALLNQAGLDQAAGRP